MKWRVEYSRNAARFIQAEAVKDEVRKQIETFLRKLQGESINVDVKKLKVLITTLILGCFEVVI